MTPFVASVVPSTAITDLANGILLLVTFFFLRHFLSKEWMENHYWLQFILMASVSSFLGFVTHIYLWNFGMMFGLWFVLNITIMETAHNFFMLGACTLSKGERPCRREMRALRLCELGVQLIMIVVMLCRWHPIQLLVVFAVLLVIPGLYFIIRLAAMGHRGSRILLCFILPLIPCLVTQVLGFHEEIVFGSLNVDGLCHLFIMADIPIVYIAARRWNYCYNAVSK